MSEPLDLAASIRANTAAVQALTAAFLQGLNSGAIAPNAVLVIPKAPANVSVASDAFDARAELQAAAEAEVVPPARVKPKKSPQGDNEVTLAQVKTAAIALSKTDRDGLAQLLETFQADKVANLKPEQYAEFLGAVEAVAA